MKEGKKEKEKYYDVVVKYKTGKAFMCTMGGDSLFTLQDSLSWSPEDCEHSTVSVKLTPGMDYTVRPRDILHIESSETNFKE